MIDQRLMERYVSQGDPAAFREIVDRHGPAVLRVCRALLHDAHEAEDAFQATFLVLVRRAPSIRDPELLGRWLVGVARLVAARSRIRLVRRSDRERRWAEMQTPTVEQDRPLLEIRRAVREELDRLPATYRQPLALCYLEGLTHEEAANRLDCPLGTVKVRLVRARRLLRDRLDRRGVALGVAFLLFLLRRDAGAAVGSLNRATAEAMTLAATGQLDLLEIQFSRAAALSRGTQFARLVVPRSVRFCLILAVFAFGLGSLALARQVSLTRDRAAADLSRLAKVLVVDCR